MRLSHPVLGTLYDALGRPVRQLSNAESLETSGLRPGVYVLRADDGVASRLAVQ